MGILNDIAAVITKSKKNMLRVAGASLLTLGATALEVMNPFLLIYSIDHAFDDDETIPSRSLILSLYAFYWAGANLLPSLRKIALSPLKSQLSQHLTEKIMEKFYSQPLSLRLGSSNSKEIQFFITNYVRVGENFLMEPNNVLLPSLLDTLAIGGTATVLYPYTGSTFFALLLAQGLSAKLGSRFVAKAEQRISDARFKAIGQVNTRLGRYTEANIFNRIDYEMEQLENDLKALNREDSRRDDVPEVVAILQSFFIAICFIGILLCGNMLFDEINNVDDLIKILLFLITFSNKLSDFSRSLSTIAGTQKIYEKIKLYLDEEHDFSKDHLLPNLNSATTKDAGLEVEFKQVSHSYDGKNYALSNVNFKIPANKLVYIVGASGAGKSTILQLLSKSYLASNGDILFNKQSIYSVNRHSVTEKIALIPQLPTLSNQTIRENIKYAIPKSSPTQINEAIKLAQLNTVITNFGELKQIGVNGALLSGGQRQRVSIARALLKIIAGNASLIIADEPTSALDANTAHLFLPIFYKLLEKVTIIVVTHDLSLIEQSRNDTIIVMDKGQVAESGTFKSLLQSNGLFAAQYNLAQQATKLKQTITPSEISEENSDSDGEESSLLKKGAIN